FPEQHVTKIARNVKALVVPEMNCGQMVREVERAAKGAPVSFISKLGEDPHTPMEIFEVIRRNCQ
ncbi:MAG: 2-oxoacid:acceptor oxidoreductase subunit alpha, partial [Candidatus Bathyarchaeia archaeon]